MKDYQKERTLELMKNESGILFASTWLQCGSLENIKGPFFSLGGRSNLGDGKDLKAEWNTAIDNIHSETGILWWLEFVKGEFVLKK